MAGWDPSSIGYSPDIIPLASVPQLHNDGEVSFQFWKKEQFGQRFCNS